MSLRKLLRAHFEQPRAIPNAEDRKLLTAARANKDKLGPDYEDLTSTGAPTTETPIVTEPPTEEATEPSTEAAQPAPDNYGYGCVRLALTFNILHFPVSQRSLFLLSLVAGIMVETIRQTTPLTTAIRQRVMATTHQINMVASEASDAESAGIRLAPSVVDFPICLRLVKTHCIF